LQAWPLSSEPEAVLNERNERAQLAKKALTWISGTWKPVYWPNISQ
jgi:hypothetical protein